MSDSYLRAVYSSNNLHQLTSSVWIPCPLQWNSQTRQWEFHFGRIRSYFMPTVFLKSSVAAVCAFGIYYGLNHPEEISKAQCLILCMEILSLILVAIGDDLICKHGQEHALSANWAYQKEALLLKSGRPKFKHRCRILSIAFVLALKISALIVGIVGVIANLDPFLAIPHVFKLDKNYTWPVKLTRSILTTYLANTAVIGFSALFLTITISCLHRIEILRILGETVPSKIYITLYKESAVVSRLLYDTDIKGTKGALTIAYFGIIMAVGMIFVAVESHNALLLALALAFIIDFRICLQLLIETGCALNKNSNKTLHKWKAAKNLERGIGIGGFELRKIFASLHVISIPAGGVGIIDADMKVNYTRSLLENIVDAIITRHIIVG